MITDDTIVALSTANGTGAIAVIRLSGPQSFSIIEMVFKKGNKKEFIFSKAETHKAYFGIIEVNNVIIDEVVVTLFKNPKSYTGEDIVEISCHGSPYIQQEIINAILKCGARLANPGEFTQRAFLNGKLDLSQAEAVADVIASENKAQHQIAIQQMRGGFSSEIKALREQLINFAALIELELDFTEEDVEFADRKELHNLLNNLESHISNLISSFEYGNVIKEGVPVAIIGKPNAGKSSLLNALLNEERAIVSDIAGTTRDVIEDTLVVEGIKFRFIDTAGLRNTEDKIEAIGVEKAKEKVAQAKIVIHLFEEDLDVLKDLKPLLDDKVVFNLLSKSDINDWVNDRFENHLNETYPDYYQFGISVKTGFNIPLLKEKLIESINKIQSNSSTIVTNVRHKNELEKSLIALENVKNGLQINLSGDLLAIDIREALQHLGEITGDIDVDKDILGTIFGKFCIGK